MACMKLRKKPNCHLNARLHSAMGKRVICKCLDESLIVVQMSLDCALGDRFFGPLEALRTRTSVYLSCWRHGDFKTVESMKKMKKICTGLRVSADSGGVRKSRAP
jgi:hypothetical protein